VKTNKLSVRLSDRSLSHVLPLGGVLVERGEAKAPERMEIPKAPHTAPPAHRR
jgi:hypothetical protein